MSNFADDLLDDLGSLEEATADLEAKVKSAQPTATASNKANQIDAASMALEAAKAAQFAAEESHKAAEAAIKLSHEQKAQVLELTDANVSWRQSLRAAHSELNGSKSTTSILMAFTLMISLIATGIMGWLYYSMNKKLEVFKRDILDLIKTENMLFNKQITLKVDQLSSLIESLSAEIQGLARSGQTASAVPTRVEIHPNAPEVILSPEQAIPLPIQPIEPMHYPEQTVPSPHQEIHGDAMQNGHSDPLHTETAHPASHNPDSGMPSTVPLHNKQPLLAEHQTAPTIAAEQLNHLQHLVEKILSAQQQLQASTLQALNAPGKSQSVSQGSGLTHEQEQKLNGISWLVRQQDKLLKDIQKTLEAQQEANKNKGENQLNKIEASLTELANQVQALKTQQNQIQQQVQALQKETEKLSAKPKPYSYQSK